MNVGIIPYNIFLRNSEKQMNKGVDFNKIAIGIWNIYTSMATNWQS